MVEESIELRHAREAVEKYEFFLKMYEDLLALGGWQGHDALYRKNIAYFGEQLAGARRELSHWEEEHRK